MSGDLFEGTLETLALAEGVMLLRGFASARAADLERVVADVLARAPLRHMRTPGGRRMSVAMSNCGTLGWVSDERGYRYSATDPEQGGHWPCMPQKLHRLAREAAARAGFAGFDPDACLINRYEPGARMSLHQDRDERDFSQPIVSASFGLPATFLLGGATRRERPSRLDLQPGDVLVFGGPARLRFHGVLPLAAGRHERLGAARINLTFRKAG